MANHNKTGTTTHIKLALHLTEHGVGDGRLGDEELLLADLQQNRLHLLGQVVLTLNESGRKDIVNLHYFH